ncbi:hypothetical protein Poli38472_007999 [Pythium oligandrum]|uniref:Protein kinase domain-containing protein n=1 Tax=Pythium oligandrum TaxID=41045 RepID=A0A8K1FMZ8_PYTOL|nr:hypothetical protein Poli38472_007999 [Pythium oligandrum]|eukprot:TMW65357.1 hypothetical protein Poli38472_007999 [Pythium oligandrum]
MNRRAAIPSTLHAHFTMPFTKFKSFSEEWNMCGKYDPMRRVNVVSDPKLQRKRLPHLMVEKCVRLQAGLVLDYLRNDLEMLAFLVQYAHATQSVWHHNILQLRGYFVFNTKVYVFYEYCELGSLRNAYIRDSNPLLRLQARTNEQEVRRVMRQICQATKYLHENGIAHGDLALENIFVTNRNVCKIGDFDHAVFVGPENQRYPLKAFEPRRPMYAAPELYMHTGEQKMIDLFKVDSWALGIILIMLMTKKPLLDSAIDQDTSYQLYKRIGLRPYLRAMYLEQSAVFRFSDDMIQVAEGLLEINPLKRFTIEQVLACVWFQIDDEEDVEDDEEEDIAKAVAEEVVEGEAKVEEAGGDGMGKQGQDDGEDSSDDGFYY